MFKWRSYEQGKPDYNLEFNGLPIGKILVRDKAPIQPEGYFWTSLLGSESGPYTDIMVARADLVYRADKWINMEEGKTDE